MYRKFFEKFWLPAATYVYTEYTHSNTLHSKKKMEEKAAAEKKDSIRDIWGFYIFNDDPNFKYLARFFALIIYFFILLLLLLLLLPLLFVCLFQTIIYIFRRVNGFFLWKKREHDEWKSLSRENFPLSPFFASSF